MNKAGKIVLLVMILVMAFVAYLWYDNDCHFEWETSASGSESSHAESRDFRVFCGVDDEDTTSPDIVTDARPY